MAPVWGVDEKELETGPGVSFEGAKAVDLATAKKITSLIVLLSSNHEGQNTLFWFIPVPANSVKITHYLAISEIGIKRKKVM